MADHPELVKPKLPVSVHREDLLAALHSLDIEAERVKEIHMDSQDITVTVFLYGQDGARKLAAGDNGYLSQTVRIPITDD